jgi:hypothetical protein
VIFPAENIFSGEFHNKFFIKIPRIFPFRKKGYCSDMISTSSEGRRRHRHGPRALSGGFGDDVVGEVAGAVQLPGDILPLILQISFGRNLRTGHNQGSNMTIGK